MSTYDEHRAQSVQHVENGRRIVERQRRVVRAMKTRRVGTQDAEFMLALFELAQAIFERDLAELERVRRAALNDPATFEAHARVEADLP